ncbi:AMP-binding enzyme, partial [Streptomyces zhaozhouensis]
MSTQSRGKIEDILPLSPLQEGLLFLQISGREGLDIYTGQSKFDLEGDVDPAALRAAAQKLLDRHTNLRAAFRQRKSGEWAQLVLRKVKAPWTEFDLSDLPADAREAESLRIARETRWAPFDPSRPPLLRFTLIRLGGDRFRFLLTHHHLLLDGWSMPLLVRELMALYLAGGDAALPRPRPYRDYLTWLGQRDRDAAREAWSEALATLETPTLLAPEPGPVTSPPERLSFKLDREATDRLTRWARTRDLTVNTVVQGSWALTLSHVLNRTDITFGTPVSGRPAEIPGIETMIGLFVNTLPLHTRVPLDQPITQYLRALQTQQTNLLDHQWTGLSEIQQWTGHKQLFDVAMTFENYPAGHSDVATSLNGVNLRVTGSSFNAGSHFPLVLGAFVRGAELGFRIDHRPDLLSAQFAEGVRTRFLRALDAIVERPDGLVGQMDLLTPEERRQLPTLWSGPTTNATPPVDVVALFEERVAAAPVAVALVDANEQVTYGELNARANQIARWLREQGAGPERFVAVDMPRGTEAVTALLGVLKSGAAYLPLDPDYPAERTTHILTDA